MPGNEYVLLVQVLIVNFPILLIVLAENQTLSPLEGSLVISQGWNAYT